MFLGETRYLTWAIANFGRAVFDLAGSGEPTRTPLEPQGTAKQAQIADLARSVSRHHGRPEAEVSIALGASHAIFLAYAALLAPMHDESRVDQGPEEVLVEHPCYEPLHRVPQSLGAKVAFFERRRSEGYAVDVERILGLVTSRTRIVSLTNLHNPTGMRVPDATVRALSDALAARSPRVRLLVDEAYASFDERCDDNGLFLHSARNFGKNVVVTSSLTKTFGYGPERIGWVLAEPEVTQAISHQIVTSVGALPRSMAPIGVTLLENLAALRRELVSDLSARRELVSAWVASHPRLSWVAPTEGLFGLVHVDTNGPDNLRLRIEKGIDKHDVVVSPGAFFGEDSAFRISWARPLDHVREGLVRLTRVLEL